MNTPEQTLIRREQILGRWHLQSCEGHSPDGDVLYPYGQKPVGMLVYDAEGYMIVTLMNPDRPRFASDDRYGATPAELKAALVGFNAYCGTYTLDPDRGTVTHHAQAALSPNWVGSDQLRYVTLNGDELRLSAPPMLAGGKHWTFSLTWTRRV